MDVTASSELKPMFEAAPETRLDARDEKQIREQAASACGGEADQACMERTKLKLSEERLKEKEMENLSKGVIKGDRLTLNIMDNGKRRKLITPAGQKVRLENIIGDKQSDSTAMLPSLDQTQQYALSLVVVVASTFFWVFGIVASYAVFMRQYENTGKDYFRLIAYASAALSVFFPGSGYAIILLYFGFSAFIKEYIAKE